MQKLTRRALALYTAFLLMICLVTVPQTPLLVCRMTGSPVPPAANVPCCDVALTVNPDGTTHLMLTAPGCCELRPGSARNTLPVVAPPASPYPLAILSAAPLSAPPFTTVVESTVPVVSTPSAPRAPPIRGVSPRAPPVFS